MHGPRPPALDALRATTQDGSQQVNLAAVAAQPGASVPTLSPPSPRPHAKLEDVARLAGVAKSTVSRVLIGEKTLSIRAETRARVLAAASTLDYRPDMRARSLRTRRSFLLGLVVPDTQDPTFLALIRGAHHAALARNYSLLIACAGSDAGNDADKDVDQDAAGREPYRRLVDGNQIDGLLMTTAPLAPVSLRIPHVVIDGDAHTDGHIVGVDAQAGVRLAVEHLAEFGHRHVGCAFVAASLNAERMQRAGWQIALASAGLPGTPVSIARCGETAAASRDAIERLFEPSPNRPTALCAWDAAMAARILAVAARRGIAVPRDLSVIALRDGPVADLLIPSITAVGYPAFALGQAAATDLIDLIEGTPRAPAARLLAPGGIVRRQSVAAV
jgi:DNA-binding LacI/PurR family transcriptional regulator